MAVAPGNYSPDNWSSGYRIRTVDSADKRAELFNDFSYWMVRKFEIEVTARENYDSQLLGLIQDNVNYSVANRSRISSIDNQLQTLKNTVGSIDSYTIANRSRISSLDTQLQALKTTVSSVNDYAVTNRSRLNNVDDRLTANEGLSKANSSRISNVDGRLTANEGLSTANSSRISNVDGRLTTNESLATANSSRINNVDGRLISTESELYSLSAMVANPDLSLISNLFGVNTIASSASSGDGVYTKLQKFLNNELKAQLKELRSGVDITNTKLDNINSTLIDEVKGQLVLIRNNITALSATQLLTNAAIKDSSDKNAENLTMINGTLKGLKNYDDDSLKTYINNTLEFYFGLYFKNASGFESGINGEDGFFTKVIKGQFTRLIAELNRQLTLSFTATTDNIDAFETYLREEFSLLDDWHSLQVEWSALINENILVAIEALDKLVAKPNGAINVSVPSFDFDRLKELLDELSFGNVVNEAGTNLWDVLQQLIDSLGGLLESIVAIVPDLIDELIGLIIPENRNIFSEKMSQFTGKFETKFSSITAVTTEFTNVYSQPKNINSVQINIFDQNLKLIPDMFAENFNWLRSMLSAFMYLSTLVTCYKRIVGSGDVIE